MAAAEMRFDAELGPVPQFDLHVEFGPFRLQAERMSAEIDRLLLIDRRDQELLPEFRQRIAGVHLLGERFVQMVVHRRNASCARPRNSRAVPESKRSRWAGDSSSSDSISRPGSASPSGNG